MEDELKNELEGILTGAQADMTAERKEAHTRLMPTIRAMLQEQVVDKHGSTDGIHLGFLIKGELQDALDHGAKHAGTGLDITATEIESGDYISGHMRYFARFGNEAQCSIILADRKSAVMCDISMPTAAVVLDIVEEQLSITAMVAANCLTISKTENATTTVVWSDIDDHKWETVFDELLQGLKLTNQQDRLLRDLVLFRQYPNKLKQFYPTAYAHLVADIKTTMGDLDETD